jgi:hypothetical protein
MSDTDLFRQARQTFIDAKEEFCEAHKSGMEALERRDFRALGRAIAAELGAIEKQKAATARLEKERSAASPESP